MVESNAEQAKNDIQAATAEINQTIQTMTVTAFIAGALVVGAYMILNRNDTAELLRTIGMLLISLIFIPAQGDYKIFRLKGWKQYAQSMLVHKQGKEIVLWEERKAALKSRKVVMPIVDIGMGAAPIYILWHAAQGLWAADPVFAILVGVGVFFGGLMIPAGQNLAEW